MRGYETNVEVWGPGVLHPKHPCIEITQGDVTIVIADPYQHLLEITDKLHGMVVERMEGRS